MYWEPVAAGYSDSARRAVAISTGRLYILAHCI